MSCTGSTYRHWSTYPNQDTSQVPLVLRLLYKVTRPVVYPLFYLWIISYPFFGAYYNLAFILVAVTHILDKVSRCLVRFDAVPLLELSPWYLILLVVQLKSAFMHVKSDEPPNWLKPAVDEANRILMTYFGFRAHFEDKDAFSPDQRYIFALEPHSVLPVGTCPQINPISCFYPSVFSVHLTSHSPIHLTTLHYNALSHHVPCFPCLFLGGLARA